MLKGSALILLIINRTVIAVTILLLSTNHSLYIVFWCYYLDLHSSADYHSMLGSLSELYVDAVVVVSVDEEDEEEDGDDDDDEVVSSLYDL